MDQGGTPVRPFAWLERVILCRSSREFLNASFACFSSRCFPIARWSGLNIKLLGNLLHYPNSFVGLTIHFGHFGWKLECFRHVLVVGIRSEANAWLALSRTGALAQVRSRVSDACFLFPFRPRCGGLCDHSFVCTRIDWRPTLTSASWLKSDLKRLHVYMVAELLLERPRSKRCHVG